MVQRHGGLSGSRPNSLVHGVVIEILTPFCKNIFFSVFVGGGIGYQEFGKLFGGGLMVQRHEEFKWQ